MRRSLRAALVLALMATTGLAAPPVPEPDRLLEHIKFLSSDALRGRGNGSEGLERAADYIAAQFKAAGLRPGFRNGDWFQPFELAAGLSVGEGNGLVIRRPSKSTPLTLGESYFPLSATPSDSPVVLDGVPVVFAGYGISAPSVDYDDY